MGVYSERLRISPPSLTFRARKRKNFTSIISHYQKVEGKREKGAIKRKREQPEESPHGTSVVDLGQLGGVFVIV